MTFSKRRFAASAAPLAQIHVFRFEGDEQRRLNRRAARAGIRPGRGASASSRVASAGSRGASAGRAGGATRANRRAASRTAARPVFLSHPNQGGITGRTETRYEPVRGEPSRKAIAAVAAVAAAVVLSQPISNLQPAATW